MKRILPLIVVAAVLVAGGLWYRYRPVANPDPNHTHADFAVWVNGEQLDFSGPAFMSEEYHEGEPADPDADPLKKYLHLHDGNGYVIHRHKPGLTLLEFLHSLGVKTSMKPGGQMCITFPQIGQENCEGPEHWYLLFVNNLENQKFLNDDYVFADGDQLLITDSLDPAEQRKEWKQMTDEACKYSKTCPWKGEPPTENCIADPSVPCVAPNW